MYFSWRKIIFHFPSEKNVIFWGKKFIFTNNIRKIIFPWNFFGKTIFSERLRKISYFHVFFLGERSSFIFRLKNKIIFPGKINITVLDNINKDHSPVPLFWKDHIFRIFWKRKYGFSSSVSYVPSLSKCHYGLVIFSK